VLRHNHDRLRSERRLLPQIRRHRLRCRPSGRARSSAPGWPRDRRRSDERPERERRDSSTVVIAAVRSGEASPRSRTRAGSCSSWTSPGGALRLSSIPADRRVPWLAAADPAQLRIGGLWSGALVWQRRGGPVRSVPRSMRWKRWSMTASVGPMFHGCNAGGRPARRGGDMARRSGLLGGPRRAGSDLAIARLA
jgi:hypothetical protein